MCGALLILFPLLRSSACSCEVTVQTLIRIGLRSFCLRHRRIYREIAQTEEKLEKLQMRAFDCVSPTVNIAIIVLLLLSRSTVGLPAARSTLPVRAWVTP